MLRLGDIIKKVELYQPHADTSLLEKAYIFSAKVHHGQIRYSGEPYLSHPLEVTGILADLKMDLPTVSVGLLHDTVEDTLVTLEEIEALFGADIRNLVDGVTKIGQVEFSSPAEKAAENFRKMILAMANDIRVVMIKLADRLHNMRTLNYMPPEKQKRIAQETMDIYAPLANRLGIGRLKWELEDLSFRYLEPEMYYELRSKIAKTRRDRNKLVEQTQKLLKTELDKTGIKAEVTGRPKHFYSIYSKIQRKGVTFEEIMDLLGVRVITDSIQNCYAALGVVHSLWKPIPREFDDYIAMPKPNYYQSLHTAVIGPHAQPLEVQIRTDEMHRIAESGIAAHWIYKEGGQVEDKYSERFTWLQQLLEWQQDVKDPQEFMRSVKTELFPDEVFIFTPKGDVRNFPKGATPIDFAYNIHTDIGHHCVGAKVNGKLAPLNYELKNGEIVEIITSPLHQPSRDWLKIARTGKALNRIRYWLRAQQKQRSTTLGREICEKEMRHYALNLSKLERSGQLKEIAIMFNCQGVDDLMAAIGYGKISVRQIAAKILPPESLEKQQAESGFSKLLKKVTPSSQAVKIKGFDDLLINYARCCNPVVGEDVIGFITRGRGVTIHRADCGNALNLSDPERRIEVEWTQSKSIQPVGIEVVSADRQGVLAEITGAISKIGINIINAKIHVDAGNKATHNFVIEVMDIKQLHKVLKAIQQIKDVLTVERIKTA
ncbi:MAG: bifunctional (p)ppGpp synthetase/guanosine-3',5'-bis(diphosphate) 3'-pyrophosphohydrolase [Candidatus Schekmanbacteria bacterium]|nr:bifunctional (p)ppGpp synthetase/guanosine-3',5'-bis(diphosphate) 3'-pyrophosphohydrolase [Candidatus Schekmanbacteria bacterium]